MIILKFADPSGIPMIVRHSRTPATMWSSVRYHPPMMNQMMLPIVEPAPLPGCGTTARPNGQTPKNAIRSAATPNGIVMINMKHRIAANV